MALFRCGLVAGAAVLAAAVLAETGGCDDGDGLRLCAPDTAIFSAVGPRPGVLGARSGAAFFLSAEAAVTFTMLAFRVAAFEAIRAAGEAQERCAGRLFSFGFDVLLFDAAAVFGSAVLRCCVFAAVAAAAAAAVVVEVFFDPTALRFLGGMVTKDRGAGQQQQQLGCALSVCVCVSVCMCVRGKCTMGDDGSSAVRPPPRTTHPRSRRG